MAGDFRKFLSATFATGTKFAKGFEGGAGLVTGIIDIGNEMLEDSQKSREYSRDQEEKLDQINMDLDLLEEILEVEKRLKRLGFTQEQAQAKLKMYFPEKENA